MRFLDISTISSDAMKQTIQHTAAERALHPIARIIQTGLEQLDITDTKEAI